MQKASARDCARTGLDEGVNRIRSATPFSRSNWLDFRPRALGASMSNPFGKTFASFFQAGFECSSHRRRDGVRLDLIRATGHDKHVLRDYRLCKQLGFGTIRDGLRWHLIEKSPGKYDWSSWLPALEAAERVGVQVIWDLFHYGSPDHVDQAARRFPRALHRLRAGRAGGAAVGQRAPAARLPAERDQLPVVGGRRRLFPARRPGASAAGSSASSSGPRSWRRGRSSSAGRTPRSSGPSRLIHIAPHDRRRATVRAAEAEPAQGMFEAYDWIMGLAEPELGGDPSLVDVVGLQLLPAQPMVLRRPDHPHGPPRISAARRHAASKWPSDTASRSSCRKPARKGSAKPSWLHYVCNEVREAMDRGADDRGHLLVSDHRLSRLGQFAARRDRTAVDDRRGRQPPRRRAAARGIRGAARAVRRSDVARVALHGAR